MENQTTLYLRGLPESLVRELKARAARRGLTLKALVGELLERELGPSAAAPRDVLHDDRAWFERHRARLARAHPGEYVAILDQAVIDHDASFDSLARRVFALHGVRPIFMPRCTPATRTVTVRSPRRPR